MSDQPSFPTPPDVQDEATPGRFIVTFEEDAITAGMASLKKAAGIGKLPSAADFEASAIEIDQLDEAGGMVFPSLGIAVVTAEEADAVAGLAQISGGGAILAVEPERLFYAIDDNGLPLNYLRGYRDAVNHLYEIAAGGEGVPPEGEALASFLDDSQSTWGLKATRVDGSRFTGRGIRVAVLDTGLDLKHPDFIGRAITSRSFISGEAVQDKNGHGTHCVGTACGRNDVNGRRYGCASEAAIFVGKVLGNGGSGPTAGILAGMEWAVNNNCQVISMSLGNKVSTPSAAYEAVGQRALQRGCLIVAAAGNHRRTVPSPPGAVGQPANSPSIMAVAAVDQRLGLASFSCISGGAAGASVDIAGPGVAVYSSWPMDTRYETLNGTSMATPHVAGIAAMWSQSQRATGPRLWQLLTSRASRLSLPAADVGSGLVRAPL
ncbi:S8 family serine peptidase [Paludisphaera sp.]|uniref:S8 family serine peptidase n=1 Tax=Paludisphaera sp. TaxID=2017432 RepID=UPI00301BF842